MIKFICISSDSPTVASPSRIYFLTVSEYREYPSTDFIFKQRLSIKNQIFLVNVPESRFVLAHKEIDENGLLKGYKEIITNEIITEFGSVYDTEFILGYRTGDITAYANINICECGIKTLGVMCRRCISKKSHTCDNCKTMFIKKSSSKPIMFKGSMKNFCPACIKKIDTCSSCGEYVFKNTLMHISGEWVCTKCFAGKSTNIDSCSVCGTFHNKEELSQQKQCHVCDHGLNNGTDVETRSYSYKPEFHIYRLNSSDDSIPLGIELEVLNKKVKRSFITSYIDKKINHKGNIFYFKVDASIENRGSGQYGESFEMVSHPMTYNFIQNNHSLIESIMELKKYGCTSYRSGTCGMHIHMDSSFFTPSHLLRFLKMIYDNDDFTYLISDRQDREWFDLYCSMRPPFRIEDAAKTKRNSSDRESRHVAVNMSSGYTVEVRIFRGTLNFERFMKNVEFCVSLYNYTKENRSCSVDGFKNYVSSSQYSYLYNFLKDKKEI